MTLLTIFLEKTVTEQAPILTAIFNQSLTAGTLPDDWLKANIAHIFKKGNTNLANNTGQYHSYVYATNSWNI